MEPQDFKTFNGARCRQLRTRAGLTQSETAEKIYASQSYLAKLEMGVKKPSAEALYRLAALFGCLMEDFFV